MERITKDRAARFVEGLEQDHGLAPKTIARLHSSLSMLWKWAAKREVVSANVWQGLSEGLQAKDRRRKIEIGGHRPYEPEEVVKLLRANPNEGRKWSYGAAVWDLLRLALLTGARANEVCSLRVCDVTREGTGIKVDEAFAKTGNSVREVPLHPLAQDIWGCPVSVDGLSACGLGVGHGGLHVCFVGHWRTISQRRMEPHWIVPAFDVAEACHPGFSL